MRLLDVRTLLAIILTVPVVVLAALEKPIPDALVGFDGLALGFFFKEKLSELNEARKR